MSETPAPTPAPAPAPAPPARRGRPPAGWRDRFLAALGRTGNVLASCRHAGASARTIYRHRAKDGKFAAAWERALEDAADVLELEARRRAVRGTERPVYQGGKLVGHVTEYSDTLLMFLLRAARPGKYGPPARQGADPTMPPAPGDGGGAVRLIEVVIPPRPGGGDDGEAPPR